MAFPALFSIIRGETQGGAVGPAQSIPYIQKGSLDMKAPVTFAIAGFGDRGSTYASMQKLFPEKMKVVAVADLDPRKVEKARQLYDIPQENCFSSAEEMLEQEKLADVMVVSTMDRQHVGHAIPALRKGYNILMETALHFFPSSQVRMSISWQDFCRIMGLVSWELRQLPRTKEWAWCQ